MNSKNELKIVIPNGSCVLIPESATADETTCNKRETIFKKVPASELSLSDQFMNYKPKTEPERKFMEEIKKEKGIPDFWVPIYDPSFDDNGHICYEPGKKPAVGKSYRWWKETAKNFLPERGSRLGTKREYIAFLAVTIKELVVSGKPVELAWNAVFNDSKELGLENTYKILTKDEKNGGFWIAGVYYFVYSNFGPLPGLYHFDYLGNDFSDSCGWIVLTEGSTDH